MLDVIANIIITTLGLYSVIGIAYYTYFIRIGIHKIDDDVKSPPLFMKILIIPGTVAL